MTLEHFAWFAAGFGVGSFSLAAVFVHAALREQRVRAVLVTKKSAGTQAGA